MERVYIYRKYVRLWHWVQAGSILVLLGSGLLIHLPVADFQGAVNTHHRAAGVLLANGLLGLFFYITTGEIRQLFLTIKGFFTAITAQVRYYTHGIFHGAAHPFAKSPDRRLNILQRITYLGVMFVLLPAAVSSGSLIFLAGHGLVALPGVFSIVNLSLVHTLAAWLFGSFLLVHIYLTTTGHTPLANLKAMLTGWETLNPGQPPHGGITDGNR